MRKIKLKYFSQIEALCLLLKLPGDDRAIEKAYDQVAAYDKRKHAYISLQDFEKAGNELENELISTKKFITLLNKKGLLKKNTLEVKLEFEKKMSAKEFRKRLKLPSIGEF